MSPLEIVDHPSPNHGSRRGTSAPDLVVLHYTAMDSATAAVERLCDPAYEVSAHYLIDLDGTIVQMVDETRRAWHAGAGCWGAVTDVNSHSIGIEIANPGHHGGYPPFPEPQMASVQRLLDRALDRWAILPERVVGHACVAPGRKIDPGEKFDWRRLGRSGLAVWLDPPVAASQEAPDAIRFAGAAVRLGYAAPAPDGPRDWPAPLRQVWASAAMRFLRRGPDTAPDASGIWHLERLAERWPVVDPKIATP